MMMKMHIFLFVLVFVVIVHGAETSLQKSGGRVKSKSKGKGVKQHILVTGGAGYIGTHTILVLLEAGYFITVIDNFVNSCEEGLVRVLKLTGLKAVGESVQKPLLYYENNLESTINLLEMMDKYDCHRIVFSSSATVYGLASVPITEDTPAGTGITNAYGRTKYMIEEILKDFIHSKDPSAKNPWSVVTLRYFNPVGNHPSGMIGEDPNGIPNNLMPYVSQVVAGRREQLTVFGKDYDTKDGTGVRDYIHVMDLAEGHLKALQFVEPGNKGNGRYEVFNLGTGNGYSVLEMVEAMKKASGKELPLVFGPRRGGDISECYADPAKAKLLLGWTARRNLTDMCTDLWKWSKDNPNGYDTKTANSTLGF